MSHEALHPYLAAGVPVAGAAIASASVVLVAAVAACRALATTHASLRHKLLLSALAAFAVPLPLLFGLLLANRERLYALLPSSRVSPEIVGSATVAMTAGSATSATPIDWQCPVAVLVIAMSAAFLLASVWRFASAKRRLLASAIAAPAHAIVLLDDLARRASIAQPLSLFITGGVSAPVAIGVRSPFVLLPAHAFEQLPVEGLRAVLAHEVAHVKRRDNLSSLFDTIVASIFWFNPFVWGARRDLALERERACDHAAVDDAREPAQFIDALLTLCRGTAREGQPGLSCINSSSISRRVDYIMRTDRITRSRRSIYLAFALTLLCAVVSVTAVAFVTDTPRIAGGEKRGGEKPFKIHLAVENGGPGRTRLDLSITDAETNALVLAPTLVIADGESGTMRSEIDGMVFEADALFDGLSSGVMRVRVLRDGVIVQDDEFAFRSNSVSYSGDDTQRRISLTLRDADLGDVAIALGKLTGRTVIVEPGLEGRVTIEATNEPWLGVLSRILNQVRASARGDDQTIYVGRKEWLDQQDTEQLASRRSSAATVDGITPPTVVSRVEPVYTDEAKAARIAGICIIAADIDEQGNVTDARILKPLPMGLGQAALDAVRLWKFSPAVKNGVPVRVKYNVTLSFAP